MRGSQRAQERALPLGAPAVAAEYGRGGEVVGYVRLFEKYKADLGGVGKSKGFPDRSVKYSQPDWKAEAKLFETLFKGAMTSQVIMIGIMALVVFLVVEWSKAGKKGSNRRRKGNYRRYNRKGGGSDNSKLSSAANQLEIVMAADFKPRPLLNRPEASVFKALDDAVIGRNPRWQVMAQVSLGEFLSSPDRNAYGCVNSKRVDFALMDENCCVVHAIEYQGKGHHQGSAAARDAVKKEALRKAGIGYHEVVAGHTTPSELRALVEKLVPAGAGTGPVAQFGRKAN